MQDRPPLTILSDPAEIQAAIKGLSERQLKKLEGHRDAVVAKRPDGSVLVYRPSQQPR